MSNYKENMVDMELDIWYVKYLKYKEKYVALKNATYLDLVDKSKEKYLALQRKVFGVGSLERKEKDLDLVDKRKEKYLALQHNQTIGGAPPSILKRLTGERGKPPIKSIYIVNTMREMITDWFNGRYSFTSLRDKYNNCNIDLINDKFFKYSIYDIDIPKALQQSDTTLAANALVESARKFIESQNNNKIILTCNEVECWDKDLKQEGIKDRYYNIEILDKNASMLLSDKLWIIAVATAEKQLESIHNILQDAAPKCILGLCQYHKIGGLNDSRKAYGLFEQAMELAKQEIEKFQASVAKGDKISKQVADSNEYAKKIYYRATFMKGMCLINNMAYVANNQNVKADIANQGIVFSTDEHIIDYKKFKNVKQGLELIKNIADQGYADAEYQIGMYYMNGISEGYMRDINEALKYFQRAANQQHSCAQYELGKCYMDGIGVEKDYKESIKLFAKSAAQGYWFAIKKLKQLLPKKNSHSI